jgi:hypothetical protein
MRPTSRRANAYAGNAVNVITSTPMYLTVAYAVCVSSMRQAGAVT